MFDNISDMREEKGLQVKVEELSRQCVSEEAGREAWQKPGENEKATLM